MNKEKSNIEIKNKILEILYDKAPNSIRDVRLYELLPNVDRDVIDMAIKDMLDDHKLARSFETTNKLIVIQKELANRESVSLKNYPEDLPLKGTYKIGDRVVPRILDGDRMRGEDINETIEAIIEYTNEIDHMIEQRISHETEKIYRQMIGIFGVFVSIFAIIIISTDKMLRFSPEVLENSPFNLLIKSAALFLPVGIVIGVLVFIVMRGSRK